MAKTTTTTASAPARRTARAAAASPQTLRTPPTSPARARARQVAPGAPLKPRRPWSAELDGPTDDASADTMMMGRALWPEPQGGIQMLLQSLLPDSEARKRPL